jgi:uncharacterized protein (TIGR02001 family)
MKVNVGLPTLRRLSLALILAMGAGFASAQDEAPVEEDSNLLTGTIGFYSDYRFRGITQTNEDPALQIGGELALPAGLYAGLWASNVDFEPVDRASYELDTFVGWRGSLTEEVSADIQWVRYNYLTDFPNSLEYNEIIGKLSYAGLTGMIGYSNDFLNSDETGIYYNLTYSLPLENDFSLSAAVGYYDIDLATGGSDSIVDYNIGLSRSYGSLTVALNYIATNDGVPSLFSGLSDNQMVFSISTAFGLF